MKKETRNKISNQTGVTLIALVITIIVLIIIAGISIGTGISREFDTFESLKLM